MADNHLNGTADTVQYRRAKLWQIILVAFNAFNGMAVYFLIGLASYSASIGYGIATMAVGGLLTFTRIFDAVTDPLLAFVYDRVNTPFGKVRPLMFLGWAIQCTGLLCMFNFFSSKGHGVATFLGFYMLYVIGYTIINMTAQTLPALMTNDPKQRPTVGVWQTVLNYLTPMVLNIVVYTRLMPAFGGNFNQEFLNVVTWMCVGISFLGVILVCIGISEYDKPENFVGLGKKEHLKISDMVAALKENKPLQSYIISAASDKVAQQASSASIVSTMLNGILIGNMGLATTLSMIGMLPSILFAAFGARYAGRHGNKESIVTWTRNSLIANVVMIVFFIVIRLTAGTHSIASMGLPMILFVVLTFVVNGFSMCITTANTGFMADIIDYELDRSGKYIPAVITGTYSLIDKIVSSFSAAIATACVALIGYTSTMPQPDDPATGGVFWMTMFLRYGLAVLGFLCTLWAMRSCKLDKEAMAETQKRIADRKEAAQKELFEEELHRGDAQNA
ncbi:MAG: MFS transporter [Lachnospiraceae bacterium]|nr:MFS transporter [Lachnospiraceae bacterium]